MKWWDGSYSKIIITKWVSQNVICTCSIVHPLFTLENQQSHYENTFPSIIDRLMSYITSRTEKSVSNMDASRGVEIGNMVLEIFQFDRIDHLPT